jgi:hypothetical protein
MKILSILIFSVSISTSAFAVDAVTTNAILATKMPGGSCLPSYADCDAAVLNAANICNTMNLDKYGVAISSALALSSVSGSVTNSCAKYDDVMKIANAGLAAYHTACFAAQSACQTSCAKAVGAIQAQNKVFYGQYTLHNGLANKPGPDQVAERALATKAMEDSESCVSLDMSKAQDLVTSCAAIKTNIAFAAAGIVGIIAESDAAKNCKKKTSTTDCKTNSADPKCYVDCSMPEHASKAQCICQKTPNAKGCPGAVAYDAGVGIQTVGNTPESDLKIPNPNFDGGGSGFAPTPIGGGSASSGGGLGGSGGDSGGGGGADGFSGGGKGADASLKTGGKKMSTDILSGFDGGGGGGGGSRGGGRNADSPYNAYLPGGSKDPSRGLAAAGSAEVTAGGSKSNWEKIKERYQQFSPSLNAGP